MAWLRSQANKLSVVALLALALQLGLSFGHIHRDGMFAAMSAAAQTEISSSDTNHDDDAHRDLCAICVTIAMAQSIVDTAPPALPLPELIAATRLQILTAFGIVAPRRCAFQSRAPPLA